MLRFVIWHRCVIGQLRNKFAEITCLILTPSIFAYPGQNVQLYERQVSFVRNIRSHGCI